jgi:hypothetical protein
MCPTRGYASSQKTVSYLGGFADPLSLRKVSMSTAALRMHSCRLRVEVLTSREFTTVARSLQKTTITMSAHP